MKRYVLVRGSTTGLLYLYGRDLWQYMTDKTSKHPMYEFVVDNDDSEVLRQMQALVNKDLKTEE